jgi:hypothetical protein
LGCALYAIIKRREERFRENPFSGAVLVATPETNSLQIFFSVFLLKAETRPQGNSV